MPECALCYESPAEKITLHLDDADPETVSITVCERCRSDLLAEDWITLAATSDETTTAEV